MTALLPAHSKLGASSYSRWKACPGSVRQSEGMVGVESEFAAEGTLAHTVASTILEGQPAPQCTEEMLEAVMIYVDYVQGLKGQKWIEHKFDMRSYHPHLFGTADCIAYSHTDKILTVVDYKHGQGHVVEVVENLQLMYYGLGALHNFSFPVKEIHLVIVQPRCYHPEGPIRGWTVTPLKMLDFLVDLIEDAKKTLDPAAPLIPGDHCKWCVAKPHCPALRSKALSLAKQVFAPQTPYSPEKLSEALRMLPAIEAWVKGVREFAYSESMAGREVPGWKLVEKRAHRKWRDSDQATLRIPFMFGLSAAQILESKLKSPAQIEKLIPKAEYAELAALTVAESSGSTLVPDTDNRPRTNGKTKITDAFSVINNQGDL